MAGTADSYCPVEALHRLTALTAAEERIIEGADHFFFGKLYPLGEAIGGWLAGLPPAAVIRAARAAAGAAWRCPRRG